MTRRMADSIYSVNIPVGVFPLVAGYINGPISQWSAADWARHAGHSILVRITVFASRTGRDVHMLDVEKGDATPEQAPGWVKTQRALGAADTVYCSEALWPAVRAAFTAQGVAQPPYVVAAYPGEHDATGNPLIPAGAIGHQWIDRGPYDESVVADHWPGVDPQENAMDWTDPLPNPLYDKAITDPADVRSHQFYTAAQYIQGSWVRTLNLPATEAQINAGINALAAEDTTHQAAILAAVQGVDSDVKAGVTQVVSTITAAGPVDVPALAGALTALLAPAEVAALGAAITKGSA